MGDLYCGTECSSTTFRMEHYQPTESPAHHGLADHITRTIALVPQGQFILILEVALLSLVAVDEQFFN